MKLSCPCHVDVALASASVRARAAAVRPNAASMRVNTAPVRVSFVTFCFGRRTSHCGVCGPVPPGEEISLGVSAWRPHRFTNEEGLPI
jgi:hypothetical protein